jgi:hypothetical protein
MAIPHPFAEAATSTTSEDTVTKVNTQSTKESGLVDIFYFPCIVNNREGNGKDELIRKHW